MKSFYLLMVAFFFSLAFTSSVHAQNKEKRTAAIDHIKTIFREINAFKRYSIIVIDDAEEFLGNSPDNGGSLKGFYKDDTLKKIIEWIGLSNKVIQNEYYFDKGKLVFVYARENNYRFNDSTQNFDYSKLNKSFEGRYYFDNNTLIETILDKKKKSETKKVDASDYLTAANNYKKLLNKECSKM